MTQERITEMLKALAQKLRRNDSGSVAVEFVLVLPIVLIILMGVIQFGAVLYTKSEMINTARETARRMAVAELSETDAVTLAKNILNDTGTRFTVTATAVASDVTVLITIPMDDAALGLVFPVDFSGETLSAQVVMRAEG